MTINWSILETTNTLEQSRGSLGKSCRLPSLPAPASHQAPSISQKRVSQCAAPSTPGKGPALLAGCATRTRQLTKADPRNWHRASSQVLRPARIEQLMGEAHDRIRGYNNHPIEGTISILSSYKRLQLVTRRSGTLAKIGHPTKCRGRRAKPLGQLPAQLQHASRKQLLRHGQ